MELNQVKLSLQNFREQAQKIKNILENFNVLNYVSTPAASFWNQIINVFVIPNSINRLVFSNQFFEIVINIQKILLEEMFFLDKQKAPNLLLVSQNDELIKIREKKSNLLENLQQNPNNFIQQDEQILNNISQQITQTELEKQIKFCKEVYFQNIFQISLSFDQLYLNLKNSLLKPNFSLILMEMIQKLSINFKQENTLNQQIIATTTSYIQKNKILFEKQQKTKQIVQKMKILNQDITEQEKKISESKENRTATLSQGNKRQFNLKQRRN
ncbi:hypothetical protein PPERSA_05364 [Pseudocohnilembus persalinus]|uniref:Uncharacterized protein n=1 Tax=Pseudocohnilembus persalinus TaxID=266149 RepID=A0A0V0R852_PSEPJ|nr:hypothetical protein PPERSA_05364 [Pseudocohnilembus persalinus]|eukprot:KRX10544.1 hypothetical protein PPERSA_05364 [Pseudocohnilembus persalinus]